MTTTRNNKQVHTANVTQERETAYTINVNNKVNKLKRGQNQEKRAVTLQKRLEKICR